MQDTVSSRSFFPNGLIRSLDLEPLIHLVAAHTATRRGYEAMLSLLDDRSHRNKSPNAFRADNVSSRQRRASRSSFNSNPAMRRANGNRKASMLLSIAQSSSESREAYESVEQATLAFHENDHDLNVPPFYAKDSGPMDTTTRPVTDDDEWLDLSPEEWTLESILQAEQVIGTLIKVRNWASSSKYEMWMPTLAAIGQGVDPNKELDAIHTEIGDAIKIQRARTALDLNGKNVSKTLQCGSIFCCCFSPLLNNSHTLSS